MLLKFIVTIVATLIIVGAQKYLSTRKLWQLGAIVPLISIVILAEIYLAKPIPMNDSIFPCAIVIFVELLIWVEGRHQYRKGELIKMKAKDID